MEWEQAGYIVAWEQGWVYCGMGMRCIAAGHGNKAGYIVAWE